MFSKLTIVKLVGFIILGFVVIQGQVLPVNATITFFMGIGAGMLIMYRPGLSVPKKKIKKKENMEFIEDESDFDTMSEEEYRPVSPIEIESDIFEEIDNYSESKLSEDLLSQMPDYVKPEQKPIVENCITRSKRRVQRKENV